MNTIGSMKHKHHQIRKQKREQAGQSHCSETNNSRERVLRMHVQSNDDQPHQKRLRLTQPARAAPLRGTTSVERDAVCRLVGCS